MNSSKMAVSICLAVLCMSMNLNAAMTLSDITFTDNHAGEVNITAGVAGAGAGGGMVFWDATLDNELLKLYKEPSQLDPGATSWTSSYNPYFRGRYDFNINALDFPPSGQPSAYTPAHTVGVARAISGVLNSIQYQAVPPAGAWADIDTSKVKLHCIGYNADVTDTAAIGCNMLNADFQPQQDMTPEQTDIGFTDINAKYPFGTPFRFDVDLHARPTSIMGMGGMTRFVWTPDDPQSPDGPGNLAVDVATCNPWRSTYSTPLESHVGFAPLFFGDEEDAEMFEGALMCTTAHYMDVGPSMSDDDTDRIGLVVDGHPGTTNYLQIFLPDRIMEAWGLTNLTDADAVKNQLGYFADGLQLDESTAAPEVTRLAADTPVFEFDWDGDGAPDAGCLVRFSFVFPSEPAGGARAAARGLAAEVGPKGATPSDPVTPVIKANGQTGTVSIAAGTTLNVTVALNVTAQYAGIPVDWWFVACRYEWAGMPDGAAPQWFCMPTDRQLTPFDINNPATCQPIYMGPLFNLPEYAVLNMPLPAGHYQLWFAVDYPMDGILDLTGMIEMDTVTVIAGDSM